MLYKDLITKHFLIQEGMIGYDQHYAIAIKTGK